jgi:uncharacterized protein (DUF342 family)
MNNEIKIENSVDFKFSSDGLTLFAVFKPSGNKLDTLTLELVYQRLKELELSCLFIEEHCIFEFIHRYKRATEEFMLKIGERRNATCGITVSSDHLKAHLVLTPNFGGKAITLKDIQNLLLVKGVVFGIVPTEKIEAILEKGHVTDFLIAKGIEPIAGIDTQFKDLTPQRHERKPLVDDKGNVDFRELGDIVMVHKSDVLIQRIPPIPGKKGRDIFGNELIPVEGLDIPFAKDLSGVYVNPEDENQLLSFISGQPILIPNGMIVSPILTVENVNLLSGNIRFDGSVIVLGNVDVDMKVYALADITIGGDVMNARIECKGNLKINGGVTGNSELIVGGYIQIKGGIQKYTAKSDAATVEISEHQHLKKIAARGCISVDFAENCIIEAGIDIVINKYAINCELMAENKIVIGTGGGGYEQQSSIIGGVTWAMLLVKALTIGSSSGVKTQVQVGSNPYIQHRLMQIKNALLQLSSEQEKIDKLLEWLNNHPEKNNEETSAKLQHTRSKLAIDNNIYLAELDELKSHIKIIAKAKVISERSIYSGTEIKINKSRWIAHENQNRKRTFREEERKIVISHK